MYLEEDEVEELDDFVCPISSMLIEEPVIADDGRTYDRASIESWFQSCEKRGFAITSPWTMQEMTRRLRENTEIRSALAGTLHERCFRGRLEGIANIHELRSVFAQLDPLRDELAEFLEGWQPPQLVVIGSESSGKSSVLERLVMMPIFPTDEGICTRLPVHVRLRNRKAAEAPQLEIFNLRTNTTEEGPFMIPAQSGSLDVREKIGEILARENVQHGVSGERIIILHVSGPHVPSIDLVDMPGLLSAPANVREQTRKLLEDHIARHGEYSFYLAVVPASMRPNTSMAMEFVQSKKLEPRTFGVFTKCDELAAKKLDSFKHLLNDPPNPKFGGMALRPHGWYATMNAPIDASNFARLRAQSAEEVKFFHDNLPEMLGRGRAACAGLVRALSAEYLNHVRGSWGPLTMRKLDQVPLPT